jgi:hypothetical protein
LFDGPSRARKIGQEVEVRRIKTHLAQPPDSEPLPAAIYG